MSNVVQIDKVQHSGIKVINFKLSSKVEHYHLTPVTILEFEQVARDLPIVFVKNPETGNFHSVCLMGFETGQNFVFKDNKWKAGYIPSGLRRFPFSLMKLEDGKLSVGIDTESDLISPDGNALFKDNKETAFFNEVKTFLADYVEREEITAACIEHYYNLGLFVERSLNVSFDGSEKKISGIYVVDTEKLNALNDKQFLDLKNRGLLKSLYIHLSSLDKVNNLVRLKNS